MESDEETDFQSTWRGVPGTIILINAFENSKHNIYEPIHVATCRLIRQHMRASSSQFIGISIFGTEESSSTFDTKPVIEIIPLSQPSIDDYDKLKNTDISSFKEANEFKFSDVLWHCSKMFANCKKQLSSRTVIILMRLDTPPIVIDQNPTLNRARDLVDTNIDIRLINISKHEYNIDMYYEKLLRIANKGMDFIIPEPVWDSAKIEKLMYQESHRHLAVANLTFEIGKDFNIGVGVYTLLKKPGQNFKKNANLDRDTNALLTSVTKTMKVTVDIDDDEQDGSRVKQVPLLKSEILYYQEYGGERVEFTDSEMQTIKNPFGTPIVKLLGFKPATMVCKEKWYVKMGYFLFPNETIIEGSTIAFKALHTACKDMGMIAICVLCTRVNAKPIIVALNPCSKPLNIDAEIGFDVINIPFVESVRDLKINEEDGNDSDLSVEAAHKSLMTDIINKMAIDYTAEMVENPKLQSQYKAIEAIALNDDHLEELVDTTVPSPDKFQEIKDDLFEEIFGPFGYNCLKRSSSKLPSQSGKKKKVDNIDEDLLNTRLQNKKVYDYTVAQLKDILKYKDIQNLPALTGLKKTELVELVYKHCV